MVIGSAAFILGERVILDGGDIEVEATLRFDAEHQAWFAIPDWHTQRELAV